MFASCLFGRVFIALLIYNKHTKMCTFKSVLTDKSDICFVALDQSSQKISTCITLKNFFSPLYSYLQEPPYSDVHSLPDPRMPLTPHPTPLPNFTGTTDLLSITADQTLARDFKLLCALFCLVYFSYNYFEIQQSTCTCQYSFILIVQQDFN